MTTYYYGIALPSTRKMKRTFYGISGILLFAVALFQAGYHDHLLLQAGLIN